MFFTDRRTIWVICIVWWYASAETDTPIFVHSGYDGTGVMGTNLKQTRVATIKPLAERGPNIICINILKDISLT